jgi:flagellar export protein FliJ
MAGRFVFRLSRLLDIRERKVEDCEKALADATVRTQAAECHLQEILDEEALLNRQWLDAAAHRFEADQIIDFERALSALSIAQAQASVKLAECQRVQLECRIQLDQAMSKLKALKKMREHRKARFTYESNRRDQNLLDELAMLRLRQGAL